MDYHGRIMNIPRNEDAAVDRYACGHRDARHAAAEIVLEAQAEIERLRAENHVLREMNRQREEFGARLAALDHPAGR